jgi:hypothetical protein
MMIEGFAAAAFVAGLGWLYQTRTKPDAKPRNVEVAKRTRFESAAASKDLRDLRKGEGKGGKIEFGLR